VYLVRDNDAQKSKAVAAVIVDRVIGLYGLFALGSVASIAAWLGGWVGTELYPILLIAPALTLAGSIAVGILAAFDYGRGTLPHRIISRFPSILHNLMFALADYTKSGAQLFQAIVLSMLSHALVVLAFFVMAVLLQDPLTITQHLALDPLAMVLNIVPLTPGGLGITEGMFAYLFQQAGSTNGAMIALLGRAAQYVVFAVGGTAALVAVRAAQPQDDAQPAVRTTDVR
jgi:uncharacterized protein (TIRG00374 family)